MVTTEESTTAREALAARRRTVDPALRAAVDTLPERMRLIAGYHMGWWNEHGQSVRTDGGKALRSAVVLLAAEAVGGTAASALPAAVSVELVHNFSLLHDDVVDGDLTRRHRPTAWSMFGRGAAILAGDALLALASDVLATSAHPAARESVRTLNHTVLELIRGQTIDLAFESRDDVLLSECQRMAESKTGALLGCAAALGAELGGGSPQRTERLREFGTSLGLAFQHVDDLLGIWGDPATTGKPVHSDLHTRKKTLPVVAALTSRTTAGARLSHLYSQDRPLSGIDLTVAAELVELAGGRAWSQSQADHLLDRALDCLRDIDPLPRAAEELRAVAALVTRRDC